MDSRHHADGTLKNLRLRKAAINRFRKDGKFASKEKVHELLRSTGMPEWKIERVTPYEWSTTLTRKRRKAKNPKMVAAGLAREARKREARAAQKTH